MKREVVRIETEEVDKLKNLSNEGVGLPISEEVDLEYHLIWSCNLKVQDPHITKFTKSLH